MSLGFHPEENFDVNAMAAFMRQPDIYNALNDALAPAPEDVQYEEFLRNPKVRTIACCYEHSIVGFVQFQGKTSVAAELTAAFHPQARGKIAHAFTAYGINWAWQHWFTIFALVSSDNLPARQGCRLLGFEIEGRLQKAISRVETKHRRAGLYDLIVYALHNPRIR